MRAWIASKGVRRTEPEYELRDALGQPGCAVCRLALRTAARQLDILSYENVNDLDLRAKLRDARGFCNRHAWQLLEQTRDPLGVALVYKDVINTLIPELRSDGLLERLFARLRGRTKSRVANRLAATRECPVCLAERETEEVYLRLLGARIAEPSFQEAWAASSGLCWPHLLVALPRARSDEALALLSQPSRPAQPAPPPGNPESIDRGEERPSLGRRRSLPEGGAENGLSLTPGDDRSEGNSQRDPFPRPGNQGAEVPRADSVPDGEAQREGGLDDGDAAIRALALSHGRWSADRSLLPSDLVVDLQQRRLEAVTRPAGDRRPDCHACQEATEGMERLLTEALAEGISGEALGRTCGRHAWQLAQRGAGAIRVPLALLSGRHREALAAALERARTERPAMVPPGQTAAGWIGWRAASALGSPKGCALCSAEAALDREVTASAVGMRRPVALCRTHLAIASEQPGPRSDWANLLGYQAARWRQLSGALAEFIRKHDYRFSQESRGEERDSPWRAVEEVAGRKAMAK